MISIITTAYRNTKYIKNALTSFVESCDGFEYEILVGVDNCKVTMEYLISILPELNPNIKIFFFNKVGTYIIRNSLAKIAKYDKLIFFDSDDIMRKNVVKNTILYLNNGFDFYRFGYVSFRGELPYSKAKPLNIPFSHHYGAFGINKKVFLDMNGFEPWVCAADGEFFWRIQSNKYKIKLSNDVDILYRRHDNNLTSGSLTGMNSPLRKEYHHKKDIKIKENKNQPLDRLTISTYFIVDDEFCESFLKKPSYYIKNGIEKKFSIIIPTYNNTKFIDKCLDSIQKSVGKISCEILVGIDNCEETLNHVKFKFFDSRIRFFYFTKNVGPYIIKNTLSEISNSNILIFFDSDDIMHENMIERIMSKQMDFDVVKPMYLDFSNENKIDENNIYKTNKFGDGVFSIKKDIFLSMNGFEGWLCEADTDFMIRLYKNYRKISLTQDVVFFRRIHPNSLTQRKDTGIGSQKRSLYNSISRNRKNFGPIPNLVTGEYYEIFNPKINEEYNEEIQLKIEKNKEAVKFLTDKVKKTTSNIDYDFLNHVINKKEVYNPNTSKRPIRENVPDNRNNIFELKKGSLADISLKLNNPKPKRRSDIIQSNPRNKKGGSYYL